MFGTLNWHMHLELFSGRTMYCLWKVEEALLPETVQKLESNILGNIKFGIFEDT